MNDSSSVYDLGSVEIAIDATRRATQPARPIRRFRDEGAEAATPSAAGGVDIPGFLSLILPGAGQLACRQTGAGLFFLTWVGLVVATGWALIVTLEGAMTTLRILGYPGVLAVWTLGVLYLAAALLHLTGILTAGPTDGYDAAHPIVTGIASAILPGAGQILAGSRTRGAVFLCSMWAIAAMWLLDAPPVVARLDELGVIVPDALRAATQPAVRWTAPAVIWALAVYDAVAGAAAARR